MKAEKYLQQLAEQLSLEVAPKLNPFQADKTASCGGTIAGRRGAYLVSVSKMRQGNNNYIGIMIRWPKLGDSTVIKAAIDAMPEFKGFVGARKVKVSDDGAIINWTYALRFPKSSEITQLIDAVVATASKYVSGWSGRCEDCDSATQTQITAMNGIPGYHCDSCQSRIAGEQQMKANDYEQRTPRVFKALLITSAAALIYAALQTAALFLFSDGEGTPIKLWVALSVLTGVVVSKIFARYVDKIEPWPQVIYVALIALSANILADVGFLTLYIPRFDPDYIGAQYDVVKLATSLLRHWYQYRFAWSIELFITLGEFGGAAVAVEVLRKARPNFIPMFQVIATPQSARASAH